jgi:hypothetical protein
MGIEVALAGMSLAATAAGGLMQASGAKQTASANAQTAMYQAAVARNNQVIMEQNADAASTAGDVSVQNAGIRARNAVGSARATAAASGLDVNVGTPYAEQLTTDQIHLLDAATLRNNAARQAYGYRQKAADYGAEIGLRTLTAQNAKAAGDINETTSLLSGVGSFADKWGTYRNRGML